MTEIGTSERRSPSPILIVFALHFLFFSFSLPPLRRLRERSEPTKGLELSLYNILFNARNRHPEPPTSAGRKDGGLFSFAFWLFMFISVASFTRFPPFSLIYALLSSRSMVYVTVCFVAVLVLGQSTRSVFLGEFPTHHASSFFSTVRATFYMLHHPILYPSLRIGQDLRH